MHTALLLAVALQLEPSPPYKSEAATLIIETRGETAPLRVDVGGAAMLRRVPDGATLERTESDLHLLWQRVPGHARVELVLLAESSTNRLEVTAASGSSTATLRVKPLRRESPSPRPAGRVFLIVASGLALSLLMWPTFRLLWRHSRPIGAIVAVAGTIASVVFVRIWWDDYAAARDYREARCVITDRMLAYQGRERSKRFYSAMYAVELNGSPRIAGDGDRSDWTYRDDAHVQLRRFEIGKAYPCWWSVRDRNELLLEPPRRSIIRRTVVTIAVFLLIIAPGWMKPFQSSTSS